MDTTLKIIGHIRSDIVKREDAPKQGCEGGVEAIIEINDEFAEAMDGMKVGSKIDLLTWLHAADRTYLKVHPRGNASIPRRGVFTTRSPDRPNPIGIHPVTVTEITDRFIKVSPLEAIDGTPVIDIKSGYNSTKK